MAKKIITIESLQAVLNLAIENQANAQAVLDLATEKAANETNEGKKAKAQKAVEAAQTEVDEATAEVAKAQKAVDDFKADQNANGKFRAKADEYLKIYPQKDELYITTDGTVFLETNPAELHQRSIDTTKSYETYKRN